MTKTKFNNELKKEAVSTETPAERLVFLSKSESVDVVRAVAKNRMTPAEILEYLSHSSDKSVRKTVACNPNTPAETLTRLGAQFPIELLRNEALDWLLLENPNLFSEMPEATQASIAKRENCTSEMLSHLGRAGTGHGLLLALVQNGKTSPQTISEIYETDSTKLARRYETKESYLWRIQALTRLHVSRNGELDYNTAINIFWSELVGMQRSKPWRVSFSGEYDSDWCYVFSSTDWELLNDANVPEKIRIEIIAWSLLRNLSCNAKIKKILTHVRLPLALLEVFAATGNDNRLVEFIGRLEYSPIWLNGVCNPSEAAIKILKNSEKSRKALTELLSMDSCPINLLLSKHPLSESIISEESILLAMSEDSRSWVREYVASHPSSSPDTLSKLVDEHLWAANFAIERMENERVLLCLASNPRTPASKLEDIGLKCKDEFFFVLECIAENPSSPSSVLLEMAKKGVAGFAYGLAQNPNAPPELFENLLLIKDEDVHAGIARNPNSPPYILEKLVKIRNKSWEVLRSLIHNPASTEVVINHIGKLIENDPDYYGLSFELDMHINVTPEVLAILVDDRMFGDEKRMRRIALNPKVPLGSLDVLSQDSDVHIRKNVIMNPSATIELIEKLIGDENSGVRNMARKTLKLRKQELKQSEEIRHV